MTLIPQAGHDKLLLPLPKLGAHHPRSHTVPVSASSSDLSSTLISSIGFNTATLSILPLPGIC